MWLEYGIFQPIALCIAPKISKSGEATGSIAEIHFRQERFANARCFFNVAMSASLTFYQ